MKKGSSEKDLLNASYLYSFICLAFIMNTQINSNSNSVIKGPIFILGIMPRSGTNYLYNLLLLHPDCGDPEPIWEDYFLHHSDILLRYVEILSDQWKLPEENKTVQESQLCSNLGYGIISYLYAKTAKKRLVAKTPSVYNLNNFYKFFPDAYLIIIVRDGRSVVESGRKSFGWNYEIAMKRWAEAAHCRNGMGWPVVLT